MLDRVPNFLEMLIALIFVKVNHGVLSNASLGAKIFIPRS